jgi:RNA polymerase sigma-70 factor (ECF subfamily)
MAARLAVSVLQSTSDERLAELARDGSAAAFEAIVVRYREALVHHCARIVGEADAEEAVQETLVKANNALARGEEVRALSPWLHTIAHHVALNLLRARAARIPCSDEWAEYSIQLDESAEQREQLRDLLDAVHTLPVRQRKAIVMLALEGRSYEEIAARLGATPRAVGQLLNRARQSLNDRLTALSVR